MHKLIVAFFLAAVFSACASTEAEERERALEKRDRELKEREMTLGQIEIARQELTEVRDRIRDTEFRLSSAVGEFERAQEQLRLAKEMQFLRTQAERENDILQAATYRQQMEIQVQNIRSEMDNLQRTAQSIESKVARLKEVLGQ